MSQVIRFKREDSIIVVVDVQESLAVTMEDRDLIVNNITKLVKAVKVLDIPVVITEQYPKGLGKTVEEISKLFDDFKPLEKISFSCCGEQKFLDKIKESGKKNVILTGMETHICVLQTALDLLDVGYTVGIVEDAVCSYRIEDMDTAIARLTGEGVVSVTTEMIIYEFLIKAGTAEFKALLPVLEKR